jgi:type I restriction enzyme, S subunit
LQEGDFVFARTGSIEKTWKVVNAPPAVFASYLIRGKPVIKNIEDWLKHFLHSSNYLEQIGAAGAGIGRQNVNAQKLAQIEIPFPPLNEQRRIVAKIEALKARSQRVKDALEDIPQLLDQFRQSVLAAAFRGDLTADWREQNPGVEPASVLLERIRAERRRHWEEAELEKMEASGKTPKDDKWKEKYEEPEPIDGSDLPKLPVGWQWVNMDEVGEVSGGLTKNSQRNDLPLQFPYLRVANVYANKLELDEIKTIGIKEEEFERVALKQGDLLVVEGNGSIDQVGRVALWDASISPCLHQNHLIKVRFNYLKIGQYILWWLFSNKGRKQITAIASSTTGLHTLSLSKVAALPVPVAPLSEQEKIIVEIEAFFKIVENIKQQYQQVKANLDQLDQSILAKAFRGELVPQDPYDEPASVLLERICAERAKLETKTAKKSTAKTDGRRSKKTQQQDLDSTQLKLPGLE